MNFWGRKYGKEKDVFWQYADMFVFPTFYSNECFPLVLLEAMEKSVSCISTEEGGIRDIIANGETGYVIPKQDAASIAEAIEKLIINTDLKSQMGNAGRKRFEELFTEERFEITMMNCLKKSM